MPEKISSRIAWIDFAKGVTIIIVVLGHVIIGRMDLNKFIFVFHMPFFFIMAGYLLNLDKWSGADNYKKFEAKLYNRLLRPYFLAELLWYPIWFVVCHEAGFLKYLWGWCATNPFEAFIMIFIGNGNGKGLILTQLWFLPALFFTEIIFIKLYNRLNAIGAEILTLTVVVASSLGIYFANFFVMPWGVDIALAAQIFILAGVLIRKHNIIERINLQVAFVLSLIIIVAFCFNVRIDMNYRCYGNVLLFYAGGIAGTLLIMKLSALMTEGKVFELISACGRQSMMILVMHLIFANVFYEIIAATTNFPPKVFFYDPIIISGATLVGVLIPLFIAERFGKFPVLKYFCP